MKENTLKVLLIEDDANDYLLTSELLEEVKGTNYEIDWAPEYTKALASITTGSYDVCLVDYRLGKGTGTELIREAIAAGCRVPMILLTGQGDQEIDIEATEAGASEYLVKGKIEAPLLERAIRYAVSHARILETLHESEKRFRSIVESASDAIILTDFRGKIISWNGSAQTIFGYDKDEILGQSLSLLFPPEYSNKSNDDDIDPLLVSVLQHAGSKIIEMDGLKKIGDNFPLEMSFSSWETSQGAFYSGIIRDVTERKSLENQLTHQALHDPLTKLANRVLFRNRVEHALTLADRNHTPIAVLFLDLDDFKTINDTMGHAAGDELLVSVTERIQATLRLSDTPARLGGDEFAVLIEGSTHKEDAIWIAERISDVLRAPFSIEGTEVFIGVSIGIAITVTGKEKPEELLRNADVAMYSAKNQGKNRYVVFESKMHDDLMERVEIETDLRRAVENEEFVLHYQPIIDLQSKTVRGMEALVRWNHPKHGLLPPLKFIPVAEETNLIVPLGRWILMEACRQAQTWQTQYDCESSLSITVNISSRQFQHRGFVETVTDALAKSGLSAKSLILEITESVILKNTERTIKRLHELKDLGIKVAIDDFGTGYSSLSYLQRFPIDILKIDKSFIDKISQSKEGGAVARAIITMGDTLHLKTIAEGIESPDQLTALQDLGCKMGQGFYITKPLDKDNMNAFLQTAILNHDTNWLISHLSQENVNNQNQELLIS